LRKRYRAGEGKRADLDDPIVAAEVASMPDQPEPDLDAVWESEWATHVAAAAIARVKRRTKPEQFQMFELYVLKGWPVKQVAAALGVSVMQVYLARHRIGGLLRKEHARLNGQMQ
ncbi:MAG TPA: helix-turn-helix domain-containing protein, partial [Candidatus Limnocylindria bacterium]|nr:helix-turn-helix domain-containing protein [Candidatus Limnocylindria bacterium]